MISNRRFTIVLIAVAVGILLTHVLLHNKNNHHQPLNRKETKEKIIATDLVEIKSYAYSPRNIKVKKGTTVTWINEDLVPHTVTTSDKDKKYSFTFNEVGKYDYYCKPHPYMKASVEVID
jgi:plastocyanin